MQNGQLYTFIAEYSGGTFVSQVRASSITLAKSLWAQQMSLEVLGIPESKRAAFLVSVADEAAVLLSGTKGVWCAAPTVNDTMMLIHIVKTGERH